MRLHHDWTSWSVFLFLAITAFCVSLVGLPACKTTMSVEKAKRVAVSMSKASFVPPPRKIDDVMAWLNQPGDYDTTAYAQTRAEAEAQPPATASQAELAAIYFKRAKAKMYWGRYKEALDDFRLAVSQGDQAISNPHEFYLRYAVLEADYGNYAESLKWFEKARQYLESIGYYKWMVWANIRRGYLEEARSVARRANSAISSGRVSSLDRVHMAGIQKHLLEGEGRYGEAEEYSRQRLRYYERMKSQEPSQVVAERSTLARLLTLQGKTVEGELVARQGLKEALALGGPNSLLTIYMIGELRFALLAQGRQVDAEKLGQEMFKRVNAVGLEQDSLTWHEFNFEHADVLTVGRKYNEAIKHYDQTRDSFKADPQTYESKFARNPNLVLAMINAGRSEEALDRADRYFKTSMELYGEADYSTAEYLALRGLAHGRNNNQAQAVRDLNQALKTLYKENGPRRQDYMKQARFHIILESYLDLLADLEKSGRDASLDIDATAESFRLVEALSSGAVQRSLGASAARAAAVEPELADLVRREQDALQQVEGLQGTLQNALALPEDQQDKAANSRLAADIDTLKRARQSLLQEIESRFPDYADLANPQPAGIEDVQKALREGEALLAIYPSEEKTYIWAVPKTGTYRFHAADIGKSELARIVRDLRRALDPSPRTLADIPEFDLAKAHDLYQTLLGPVEAGWGQARDLIVATSGPVGQLPLGLLPTARYNLGPDSGVLFSNYKGVPWLIKKVSVARIPSASSFVSLRALPPADAARKAFAGFGDPFFTKEQYHNAQAETGTGAELRGGSIRVRGIRQTQQGDLDNRAVTSSQLERLNRLPDTKREVVEIASALEADPEADVFLGVQASESRVKGMNLADRKVIAFASHALVPGDLDGLWQPAIALSSPQVTGEINEDGLLIMDEVLRLKLNADWVVLSACNTGATDGRGSEALSGLGRSFFYAGARALLASMWPVETNSARELTTNLFKNQRQDPGLSRARAHQKSMIELIESSGLQDPVSGQIICSFAHPLFWAPFVIVGEGGAGR